MTKRRLPLALSSSLALVVLLAACTGSSGTSQKSSSASTQDAPATIKVITWTNPPTLDILNKINKQFEAKNPNITVELQSAAGFATGYASLLQTSVASRSVDVVSIKPFNPLPLKQTKNNLSTIQNYAITNVFEPLNNQPFTKQFLPDTSALMTHNDKLLGLNTGSYQVGVLYNKQIFQKYGLSVPTTYPQFLKILETLKNANVTPLYMGTSGQLNQISALYQPLMASIWLPKTKNGDLAAALDSGSAKWTDTAFTEVLTRLKQISSYLEPGYAGVPWQNTPTGFANEQAAMTATVSYNIATVSATNPNLKFGWFPLPGSDKAADNQPVSQGDLSFSILKSSTHKAAAEKWLNYVASSETYKKYVAATGISPSFKGTFNTESSALIGSRWFGKGVPATKVIPDLPAAGPFVLQQQNFQQLLMDVMSGKTSIPDAQQQLASAWEAYSK